MAAIDASSSADDDEEEEEEDEDEKEDEEEDDDDRKTSNRDADAERCCRLTPLGLASADLVRRTYTAR